MGILMGVSLGVLFGLWKIRKSQRKTRELLDEIDGLMGKEFTDENENEIEKKMSVISGRLDVTSEFFE